MSGKRSASSDLNHDNWDHDEEPEEAGTFQRASEESLQRRTIKTARRRNPISSVRNLDPAKKSAFTGFTAFSKTSISTVTPFSFLTNAENNLKHPKTNGASGNVEKSIPANDASNSSQTPLFGTSVPTNIKWNANKKSNDYFSKIKGLNESVSNWIKNHVDLNPFINLQPIFKDYEKYFKELEKEEESKSNIEIKDVEISKSSSMDKFVFKAAENIPDSTTGKTNLELDNTCTDKNKYSYDSNFIVASKVSAGFSRTGTSNTFSFACSNISTSTMSTLGTTFSFGSNSSTPNNTGFSFSGGSVPSFVVSDSIQPTSTEESHLGKEAEDDEPPKVEFTPVIEENHVYTTRCKVFVKKDGNYSDRGVGNLYLKPIEGREKFQLIVRADTNLGNLLCNFILSENIPTKRMGKKDVMLVCLPTPDVQPPPVTLLLRVKSPEEADKLLAMLKKHKK